MTIKNKLAKILGATLLLASTTPFAAQKSFGAQESLYYLLNYGPEKYQRFKNYKKDCRGILWDKLKTGPMYFKKYYSISGRDDGLKAIEVFIGNDTQPLAFLFDVDRDGRFRNTDSENEVWCEEKIIYMKDGSMDHDGLNGNEYPCDALSAFLNNIRDLKLD